MTRSDVRGEIEAGRWSSLGRHTVLINGSLSDRGRLWRAVWESGSGALLDGAAALVASGLTGFAPDRVDVTLPANHRRYAVEGVTVHRRSALPRAVRAGIPRVCVPEAAVHAAGWALTHRAATLVLCLVLQQRLTTPDRLQAAWGARRRSVVGERGRIVAQVIDDLCNGVRALGELDFARLCRERGLPEPSRQTVRETAAGRAYLDMEWDEVGLVVEIDGGHHAWALNRVADALRQNELVLAGDRVLRLPVLGLRLDPSRFMDQVARALAQTVAGAA